MHNKYNSSTFIYNMLAATKKKFKVKLNAVLFSCIYLKINLEHLHICIIFRFVIMCLIICSHCVIYRVYFTVDDATAPVSLPHYTYIHIQYIYSQIIHILRKENIK